MIPSEVGNTSQPTATASYDAGIPVTTTDSRPEQGVQAKTPVVDNSAPASDDLDAIATKTKPKRRKSGSSSPTKLSLDYLRKIGCDCVQVVEHWNAFARRRIDLFGIVDVLALHPDGRTIAVQACARADVSTRLNKITHDDHAKALAAIRRSGWTFLVHGWDKGPNGRYRVREVDVS